jgi:hypothetical protein
MNLEAPRERRNSPLDVTASPNSNNTVETKSFRDVHGANARVRVGTSQKSGMKCVGEANIGDVRAGSSNKAARFIGFDAAADESG